MTDQPSTPSTPSEATVTWHALTPQAALERQGVTVERGLTQVEADSRRAKYGPNKFAEPPQEPRWQAFLRQYRDPMQIVLLVAGVFSLFLPGQVATGRRAHRPDPAQRGDGPEPGGQGERERRRAPEDDGRLGQGPPRRVPRPAADGAARARATSSTSRPATSSRPTGASSAPPLLEIDESGPDRRERPSPEAGRGRRRGGRARRSGRPGVHEHTGDARRRAPWW